MSNPRQRPREHKDTYGSKEDQSPIQTEKHEVLQSGRNIISCGLGEFLIISGFEFSTKQLFSYRESKNE